MSSPLYTVGELVQKMRRTNGAHYGNWGLLVTDDERFVIGPERKDLNLVVPLIDIVDQAEESYPECDYEDIFFIFGTDDDGGWGWGLAQRD